MKKLELAYACPCCGGDGIERCNNPDHGFIAMCAGVHGKASDINRIGCPCCGHDEQYRMGKYKDGKKVWNQCPECFGWGKLTKEDCEKLLDEYSIDQPIEDFELTTP